MTIPDNWIASGPLLECIDNSGTGESLTLNEVYHSTNAMGWYTLSDTVYVVNNQGNTLGYNRRRFKVSAANFVRVEGNKIEFTLQSGPIKEVGVNGCQIDDIIRHARDTLQSFQGAIPCRENTHAIDKLDESLMWLEKRKQNRERRGVEGTSGQ